jgi:hypothetical protein
LGGRGFWFLVSGILDSFIEVTVQCFAFKGSMLRVQRFNAARSRVPASFLAVTVQGFNVSMFKGSKVQCLLSEWDLEFGIWNLEFGIWDL